MVSVRGERFVFFGRGFKFLFSLKFITMFMKKEHKTENLVKETKNFLKITLIRFHNIVVLVRRCKDKDKF